MSDSHERMIKDSSDLPEQLFLPKEEDDRSTPQYRLGIGLLGLLLPFLLFITAGVKPIEGIEPWELLRSVSAYYYTDGMFYFVGILLALGVFLVFYRGYGNEHNQLDRVSVVIAGITAMGVAIFPCRPPDVITNSGWMPWMGKIHYGCAGVMFFAFIFISVFLFTKSKGKEKSSLISGPRIRNFLYCISGIGMLFCMVWLCVRVYKNKSIFFPEAFAIFFFAASWLVKGRADWTLKSAGKQIVYYVRNPKRLVNK